MTLLSNSLGCYRRRRKNVLMSLQGDVPLRRLGELYTETTLGASFETCLRRREDALVGRRCYFLLRRRHDVLIRCRAGVPLRRFCNVPPRRRWTFHLRRSCDIAGTYRETSLRRRYDVLLPGG